MLDLDKLERDALIEEAREAQKDADFWFEQYKRLFRQLGGQEERKESGHDAGQALAK